MENNSLRVYCLIIGSFSVGKTTLINRLNNVPSINKNYQFTTRISLTRKSYGQTDFDKRIEIVYLELPGKAIYQSLLLELIKKIDTKLIVGMFDVTNRQSLTVLEQQFNLINNIINNKPDTITSTIKHYRIMIGNKIDLVDKRIITNNEAMVKAKMLKCRYMECTAENDLTMQDFEQYIIDIIKQQYI